MIEREQQFLADEGRADQDELWDRDRREQYKDADPPPRFPGSVRGQRCGRCGRRDGLRRGVWADVISACGHFGCGGGHVPGMTTPGGLWYD